MAGRQAVVDMVRGASATRVLTMDYEAEALDTCSCRPAHAWTRVLTRERALRDVLTEASGGPAGHLGALMDLQSQASGSGPRTGRGTDQYAMEEVGRLPDDAAVLYAVDSQTDLP